VWPLSTAFDPRSVLGGPRLGTEIAVLHYKYEPLPGRSGMGYKSGLILDLDRVASRPEGGSSPLRGISTATGS
jgi:hypothetical protein